ncbi:unnamed protein product [Phytophthora fragariaefolia]|uniref:Unnamed protein product n=1 Tax=Phytophthora fragariaefolia TaxID=1490495 RepID=A0A9W6YDP8_9STRA|nr:unnamed protein product [Phytophthora fragariaefolia]
MTGDQDRSLTSPTIANTAADSGSSGAAVSSDNEWSDTDESPLASIVDDDDYETHEGCEEMEESDEDLSAFLVDRSVAEQASRLVRDDPCEQKCLKRKEAELGNFLQSVSGMERSERITSVMTALAVLMQADTTSFHRGNGVRNNFRYFLPLVGKVCALSFGASYGSCRGKGTDQVNSMLYEFLTKNVIGRQIRRLTVYADNCGGQNKSNHVIHFLLALVHQGLLDSVDFKFFVRRHTTNACDRGFGKIRNRVARVDCWTVDGVVKNVATAASSSVVTRITLEDNILRDFKTRLSELYKPLSSVQKYHIFSANKDKPGVITCKSFPNDDGISEDLRRKIDKVKTPTKHVQDEQQNSPSFVKQLEQAMNDIEDASALPKAKQPERSTTKKKARKESST